MADQNEDPFGQNNDRNANSNSETDALFGGLFPNSAFQALPTSLESEEYNMEHTRRGKCVIFNNKVLLLPHGMTTDISGDHLQFECTIIRARERVTIMESVTSPFCNITTTSTVVGYQMPPYASGPRGTSTSPSGAIEARRINSFFSGQVGSSASTMPYKLLYFFVQTFHFHTKLSERRGTDRDAENLYFRFRDLGFDPVIHRNFSVRQMLAELDSLGKEDHSHSDCFVCCILSHGDEDVIYGTDGKFPVNRVFEPFRGDVCLNLVGKPKLFFIQACRGDRLDDGVPVVVDTADAPGRVFRIPTHADFLMCFSTVPGFYSWRNNIQGSWFVQSLCEVLQQRARSTDLLTMMTVVCRQVAIYYESSVPGDTVVDRKKQVPSIVSTLTRLVYFSQKS